MSAPANATVLPDGQRCPGTVGTIKNLVAVVGILILYTFVSFTNFYSFLNFGRRNDVQDVNIIQLDPIVFEYEQKDIVPAIHESLMLHHNVLCADLAELEKKPREELPSPPDFPVRIRFRLSCDRLFASNRFGTGNVLRVFYNIRLVARLIGNVEVMMECTDATATKSGLVFPWLMGTFAASRSDNSTRIAASLEDACERFQPKTVHIIEDAIKYELRRMALSMVGVPHAEHPAGRFVVEDSRENELQVPMTESPLFPDAEIDDVAIHFRCGDIIERRSHPKYSYVRWIALARLISPEARSIGIITQPFKGQTRNVDRPIRSRCPRLVKAMQTYLRKKFPRAKVNLRNSADESVALAFTRLIMANQSLAGGVSTFYTMPFYASFGTTYDVTHHVDKKDTISSKSLMDLWKKKNGFRKIVNLFTREDPSK